MTTYQKATEAAVCECRPVESRTKTYYVWSCSSDAKQKITDVAEVHLTEESVIFETAAHETVTIPRDDVFLVTCQICSPPPCN